MTLVGTILDGRYEVVRRVGEGGMGVVFEGRHLALNRRVAIKMLHGELTGENHAAERFMQEAQIAGSLGHPNICEVTDVGATTDGIPYMVMPLLEGETLGDALLDAQDRGEGFPMSRSVDIVSQILSALGPAHEAGIVHRDLKPENIFLTMAGDRGDFVKVLDFGISKIVNQGQPNLRRLTSTGMVVGTPYYMAPEQAAGGRDLDPRVDIYAVGALLFELLTGRPPFEGESYNEIIIKIVGDNLVPPRELNPDIPEPLEAVTLRALAKVREERYSDVQAFREALLEAGEVEDLVVHRSRRRPRSEEPPQNTLSSAAAEIRDTMPTVSVRGAALPPKKSRWTWAVGGGLLLTVVGIIALATVFRGEYGGTPSTGSAGDASPSMGARPPSRPGPQGEAMPMPLPAAPEVTVEFQGLPPGGRITLGGQELTGNRVSVPRSQWTLSFRAEAPGHLPLEGSVTPLRDTLVPLHLSSAPTTLDAGAPAPTGAEEAMTPETSPPGAMPPDGTAPAVSPPGAMPPGAPWGVIMGRHGTSVKTDYDADD